MSKRFLFITPLTPKRLLTPLRMLLFEQFLLALKNQTYKNWEALLIGEETKKDGQINYLSLKAESKEIKLIFAKEYISNLAVKPDYIIRIDDDDLINPYVLEKASALDFDCYADKFHAFYDLVSGKISLQERSWLANTVIHKYEHAMTEMGADKIPLLQCDHSKDWIEYYKNKKIIYSSRKSPVYLRLLSPTTVTSSIHGIQKTTTDQYAIFKNTITDLKTANDINFTHYTSYLKGFGKWNYFVLKDFKNEQLALENLWEKFYGQEIKKNVITKLMKKWYSLMA